MDIKPKIIEKDVENMNDLQSQLSDAANGHAMDHIIIKEKATPDKEIEIRNTRG